MKRKTILLVEDNEDDEMMTVRSLRDSGFEGEIAVVRDGQEAVDWVRGRRGADLILLDIRLPKLSGFQVLEAIRENAPTRHVPVVMLTASTEQEDMVRSYDLRANSYIRKPVDYKEFEKVVKSLGMYWTEYNQWPRMNPNSRES
jgi:two-component system, response regulator